MLEKDIDHILVTQADIIAICSRLGHQITDDYKDKNPLIIGLLKGCIPFMAELIKHIDLYCEIELMGVSSYHGGITASSDVKITKDLEVSVQNRHVLIAEDIVDTGKTLEVISRLLLHRGASSVEVVTLLDKPAGRKVPFVPKYIGKSIPKAFVVGFGLDYNEMYRNLPFVGVLKPEVYK
ncbi:MAG: hypoxanthine phosphoribosyltransferase [Candidatus Izemoplasmatales bacterium]|jgi:hypoxanthine phosphoribosyltransferase/bifunctional protein TilS/HprT|nr:hypoxanthine phosphoribosyltransferase [Candidatus Izemoplasmatales bacterium]MDD3865734.1 hypoxanthine phosphoribosyltransferase [Candidatus Izemoplasmatales bacterium]